MKNNDTGINTEITAEQMEIHTGTGVKDPNTTIDYLQDKLDEKDKLLEEAQVIIIGALWAIEDGSAGMDIPEWIKCAKEWKKQMINHKIEENSGE